jgi:predicted  nucleic acid-binding Zn-ribbon protein
VQPSHIGVFTIKGDLYNEYTSTPFSFKVNVTNQPPYLIERQIADVKVPIKGEYTFNISEGVDREKQIIKYETKERYK